MEKEPKKKKENPLGHNTVIIYVKKTTIIKSPFDYYSINTYYLYLLLLLTYSTFVKLHCNNSVIRIVRI